MKNEEITNLVKNLVKAEIKKLGFDERYISPEELSERWNISVRTLEDWRLKGKPPVFMKIQGSHRAKIAYPLNAEGGVLEVEKQWIRKSTSELSNGR